MPGPVRLSPVGWSVVVLVAAALLLSLGFLKPLQRVTAPILTPVGRVAYDVVQWVGGVFSHRSSVEELAEENASLQNRIVQLELERTTLDKQLVDLKLLRAETDFLNRKSLSGVPGRVLGRSQSSAQVLLIDIGTVQGVRSGAPVIAHDGILIGTIIAAGPATAEVRLLTAEGTDIAVRVDRQDGPSGVLVGERGVGMKLTLVPKNQSIAEEQLVLTSDIDPRIPSSLVVGKIANLEEVAGDLFQTASIIPTVAYEKLSVVTVLDL